MNVKELDKDAEILKVYCNEDINISSVLLPNSKPFEIRLILIMRGYSVRIETKEYFDFEECRKTTGIYLHCTKDNKIIEIHFNERTAANTNY